MKNLKVIFFILTVSLLYGCGETDSKNSHLQDAKEHVSDAVKDIKAAGEDANKAAKPVIKNIKKESQKAMDKAQQGLKNLSNEGKQILKKTKQDAKELINQNLNNNSKDTNEK